MKKVRLLDCTLRDGGHITGGDFGEAALRDIIANLVDAHIDIIELGFLWDFDYDADYSRFYNMERVKRILPENHGVSKFSVMLEKQGLLEHIEPYDGSVEYIRVIFKRHLWDWAFDTVHALKEKGYKVFMNAVNCTVYSDDEYLQLIERINEARPYAMSVVDTFGNMRMEDFERRFHIVDENLDEDIVLGIHLHENLGMAYSMAQRALEMKRPERDMVIDSSLLGMGRDPGNLKIEQIAEYLNYKYCSDYGLCELYDALDKHIFPLQSRYKWGYKLPYAIGSYYGLHRTYAEFLMGKPELSTRDMNVILSRIEKGEAEYYNEEYVDKMYRGYMREKRG